MARRIGPRELAAEAVHLMEVHRITALPVADAQGGWSARSTCTICCAPASSERRDATAACACPPPDPPAGARRRRRAHRRPAVLRPARRGAQGVPRARRLRHQAARRAGIEVAVISGRRSPMVAVRCRELGMRHVHQGVERQARRYSAAARAAEARRPRPAPAWAMTCRTCR